MKDCEELFGPMDEHVADCVKGFVSHVFEVILHPPIPASKPAPRLKLCRSRQRDTAMGREEDPDSRDTRPGEHYGAIALCMASDSEGMRYPSDVEEMYYLCLELRAAVILWRGELFVLVGCEV